MSRRLLILLALAGALLPVHGAGATTPPGRGDGGIGVRLVDEPAVSSGNQLARSYIVDRLVSGESTTRQIEISNTTRKTAVVGVYPAAASIERGTFAFAPAKTRNELTSWTSVSRKTLTLAPGSDALETVTIRVPRRASPGERYAVIWATVSAPGGTSVPVMLVNRVGVRVYLSVGTGSSPAADFAITGLTARRSRSGEPTLVANISNIGKQALAITGTLQLANGPAGQRAGPFAAKLAAPLLPGHAGAITMRLDPRLPRGPWRAQIRLASGDIHHTVAQTIVFPRPTAAGKAPSGSVDSTVWRHRYTLIVCMLAALAALALVAVRRRLVV